MPFINESDGLYTVSGALTEIEILDKASEIARKRLASGIAIESPLAASRYIQTALENDEREGFYVLYLDHQHQILDFICEFSGTVAACSVYPREIVKRSMNLNAAAIILAHPHPSGSLKPSQADINITTKLKTALELVDVNLLDHFICTPNGTTSLAELGHI